MYKMVVIDDEYFTCEGLKLLLDWKSLDIEIVGFSLNGEEGLELVERVNPDIVMTDIKMKFMDGLTMIKKLRSKGFKGEIIVFSGYKVFEYAQDAMENGVSNYILKPVTKDKMLDAIKIVLDKLDSRRDANGGAAEDEGIYGSETDWSNVLKYIDSNITKDAQGSGGGGGSGDHLFQPAVQEKDRDRLLGVYNPGTYGACQTAFVRHGFTDKGNNVSYIV